MSAKNTNDALEARRDVERQIVARAVSDPLFRAALLKDPKGTLEKVGLKFAPGAKVVLHEERPNTFQLVLPAAASRELSEAELASVAGGPTAVEMNFGLLVPAVRTSLNFSINFSSAGGGGGAG